MLHLVLRFVLNIYLVFYFKNVNKQGERDWQKYEKARKLHRVIDKIRETYQIDWKNKEMRIRQRAVALYFIDKVNVKQRNR